MQVGTYFKVIDNSGASSLLSIQNLSKNTIKLTIGDLILGIIKIVKFTTIIKKSLIMKALIVNTKKNYKFYNSYYISNNYNAVILLDKNLIPKGTRIYGVIIKTPLLNKILTLKSLFYNSL